MTPNHPKPEAGKPKRGKRLTPKHFTSSWHFMSFILDMALRDRGTFLDGIKPQYREPDAEEQALIDEIQAEVDAIEARLKKHYKKRPAQRLGLGEGAK